MAENSHTNKTLIMNRLKQLLFKTPDHPPYSAMIQKAIVELSEKGDSSEESISKFIEKEYKDLPVAHLTFLKHHLAKHCEFGDITLTSGKKYVIAGANPSLKTTVKGKVSQVKEIVKWDAEKQQKKSTKRHVQQRKLSLKATVKINKRPVKRMFKWDYENKQRRFRKLLAQQRNQKKNDKVKVSEKRSEPSSVRENLSVEKEAKESSRELEMAGSKKRTSHKRLKEHGLLSEALRHSKRLRNDFKQENKVEKKLDLIVEPVLADILSDKCIQMHDPRNLRVKATVRSNKLPVKSIYKWDWERKQRQLKKLQALKSNQKKNDESKVAEKHSEPNDVQENESVQEETKEFSQELVMFEPVKKTHLKRIKGTGQLPETVRRSKRLQNDFKDTEQERKADLLIEPESLSDPKCTQTQSRRSTRLARKKQEIKLSCELERPQGQNVDPDLSHITELQHKVPENRDKEVEPHSSQITELQEKEPANQMSENQEVVKKWEGIKIYRRRSKVEIQSRLIVEDTKKEVASKVSRSQASSICIDLNDDQSLGNLEDDRLITWIRRKILRSRQQKSDSKAVKKIDEQAAADGSCSASVVTTHGALETIDSVSNGAEKLPEERHKIKRIGRPPKGPRICGVIIALMAKRETEP